MFLQDVTNHGYYYCGELEILLDTKVTKVEVLCFTEHWLNYHKIQAININHFTLASAFCRENSDHSGSCILVKKGITTKELNGVKELGEEKSFELSAIELVRYAVIIICIYRSPEGKIDIFLNKLEIAIQKLMKKHKTLILCGDWNINFLHHSTHTIDLNNLLLRYNLKHTVHVPTRITKTTAMLLDVVITNERKLVNYTTVMDLGLSDHCAQILSIPIADSRNITYRINKRQYSEANVQEFIQLLDQVTWQEVYDELNVNTKFNKFMEIFLYYYNTAFPIKTIRTRDKQKASWITKGIKNSSKKMRLLNKQKRTTVMKQADVKYIEHYKKIYRKNNTRSKENGK